jgi:hypothetical protein
VARSIFTSSQARTRRVSLNNTAKWSACPPGLQIGPLASIYVGGAMRVFPRRKSRWMPCARRIFPSKVRLFSERHLRKWLHPLCFLALTSWHAVRTVMWNDLELYHDYRDFTVDPVTFPANEMREFIRNLVSQLVFLDACDADRSLQRANEQHCTRSYTPRKKYPYPDGRYPNCSWLRCSCCECDGRGGSLLSLRLK